VSDVDPHDEIERLEALIEKLDTRIAGYRKLVLAGQIGAAAGGVLLFVTLFGVVRFDPRLMIGGMTALLGGFAVWGSNYSTLKEASQELSEAEVERAGLIGKIHLRVVSDRETLH
jgi:hypothetical protein